MPLQSKTVLVIVMLLVSFSSTFLLSQYSYLPENKMKLQSIDSKETFNASISLNLEIYDIDVKTDRLYSGTFSTAVYTIFPHKMFYGALLKQDAQPGMYFFPEVNNSTTENGTKEFANYRFIRTIAIGQPLEISRAWEWKLLRKSFIVSTPFDSYELNFLYAFNMSASFSNPTFTIAIPRTIQGDWEAQTSFRRLENSPNNETLMSLGISPELFKVYSNKMVDFWVITVTLNKPYIQTIRAFITYVLPGFGLLGLLLTSLWFRKRMDLTSALTIYLGSAFFTIPFLVQILENAPYTRLSIQEIVFQTDLWLSILLASSVIFSKLRKKNSYSYDC